LGHEVCLSHPKQTKAIVHARLKSDKVDAVKCWPDFLKRRLSNKVVYVDFSQSSGHGWTIALDWNRSFHISWLEGLFQEGRGTLPIDQCVQEFFYHTRLVNETDGPRFEFPQGGELVEPHLSLAFGTNKQVCLTASR